MPLPPYATLSLLSSPNFILSLASPKRPSPSWPLASSGPLDSTKNHLRLCSRPLQHTTFLALAAYCFLSQPLFLSSLCPPFICMSYLSTIPPTTPLLPAVLLSIDSSILYLPFFCLLSLLPSSLHHPSLRQSPNNPLFGLPFLCLFTPSAALPSLCQTFLCPLFLLSLCQTFFWLLFHCSFLLYLQPIRVSLFLRQPSLCPHHSI